MNDALTVTKQFVGACAHRAARHAGCAMQRHRASAIATCWRLVLAVVAALFTSGSVHAAVDATTTSPLRWPLAGERRELRGGFGESRTNRFHAGLDLSTGGHVGAAVLAPAAGMVERVRASGVGYGRS